MPAPAKIAELVGRFRDNLDSYKRDPYNETQVRREFIDPFFQALGWDVTNERGYAEAYKDVVHEEAIKVGGGTKAPDYGFRIGGVRKFFVEAKKPAVDVKNDVHPAYQLRRYAWSAKLPLSILTDFEEFAVYDCRVKPDQGDKPATARLLYITFDQYVTRWDEIASVFARDAILRGAFDKYAEATGGKRGTAEVDAAFLAEIERWRDLLAHNLALRNPGLSQRDLNFAVQQTIDRLIFLRIGEDRGIESYGALLGLVNGGEVYARLLTRFRQADARYNSGLFYFSAEKGRGDNLDTVTPRLVIDDKVLRDILKNLYYPDSPYEFSVLPADILGQVYEQFLGKVIRLQPHGKGQRAVVEEKPAVRKAGGVFYTPTFIVDAIVRQTVGRLLAGLTLRQVAGQAARSGRKAAPLRVADIACGSGSFLLGAYQFLLDWYLAAYQAEGVEKWASGRNPRLYQNGRGEWKLTVTERKRILLAHLFGVDIDPQAVEVTKLSLLLKVLEGEDEQTLGQQLRLFPERALPDLGRNIKCGNSLIGPDFYDGQQMALLDEEETLRVNVFDWQAEFPQVFTVSPAGDSERPVGFPKTPQVSVEDAGFDAIIGNPPYGASLSAHETSYLLSHFPLQSYQLDTYLLFVEQGLSKLKDEGVLGLIIPNTWLLNLQSDTIRRVFFAQTRIDRIVHYLAPVFRATVDTEIVIFAKTLPDETHSVQVEIIQRNGRASVHSILQRRWQEGSGKPINIFERPEWTVLTDRLRKYPVLDSIAVITQGSKPFQVGKGKPPQTRKTVEDKPFVSELRQNSSFRPLLRGSLIQRYEIRWNNDYWISFGDWLAEPRYSASYDAPAKVVIRQTGDSLVATLDRNQFIVRDNLYTIVPRGDNNDLRYLLGLICSKLLTWYYQVAINPEKGEALAQVKRGHLAQMPIRTIDFSDPADVARHDRMVSLVEKMLDLHKRLAAEQTPHVRTVLQRQIEATDKQIDALVYDLYGLTAEEIGVVERTS